MKISKKAQSIEPSLSRQLFNMASKYDDVVDLTLGDPDIPPLCGIRDAACSAIQEGRTRYSANAGLKEFREVVSERFFDEYGLPIMPDSEIVSTVGGMEALYLALSCLVDEGDEVIVFAPYYVNYIQMIRMCGGVPIVIDTESANGFIPSRLSLERAITSNTVAMIVNSPCNPTGSTFSGEVLDWMAEIANEQDIVVISDEVYRTLLYDSRSHESIVTRPGMKQRTVLVDSLSKRFAMTGYRIGYAIAPKAIAENMTKMQENVAACAPLPSQYAGIEALRNWAADESLLHEFERRRDYLCDSLNKIDGLTCIRPQGAFYLFVDIADLGIDCLEFAYGLLSAEHVAVVPGTTYGKSYSNYVRLAYTLDIERLKVAVERISRYVEGFLTGKRG